MEKAQKFYQFKKNHMVTLETETRTASQVVKKEREIMKIVVVDICIWMEMKD